jgi:hypothetical protein
MQNLAKNSTLDIRPHLEEKNRVDDGYSSSGKYANIFRPRQTKLQHCMKENISQYYKKVEGKVVGCDVPQAVTLCKHVATPIFYELCRRCR